MELRITALTRRSLRENLFASFFRNWKTNFLAAGGLKNMFFPWTLNLTKISKTKWRTAMEERLKIDQLFSEKALAEALGVSKGSLRNLRSQGCPWVSLFGKAFYHGQLFMEWVLENRLRAADPSQLDKKPQSFVKKQHSE